VTICTTVFKKIQNHHIIVVYHDLSNTTVADSICKISVYKDQNDLLIDQSDLVNCLFNYELNEMTTRHDNKQFHNHYDLREHNLCFCSVVKELL